MTSNEYNIMVLKVGEAEVPGPEVFWMQDFNAWEKLSFHVVLAYNKDITFMVNTGMPLDLKLRNEEMLKFAGERAVFKSLDTIKVLANAGFSRDDIDYVAFTPVQDYTTGRLKEFKRSKIFIYRDGWVNDVAAPKYNFHNRDLFIPKDALNYIYGDGREKVIFYDNDCELIPGIRALSVGCHHRSSMAFIFNTKNGNYIFTDAVFKIENIKRMRPIGIAENIYECLDAYKKLNAIGSIIPAYDPAFDGFKI